MVTPAGGQRGETRTCADGAPDRGAHPGTAGRTRARRRAVWPTDATSFWQPGRADGAKKSDG
eukprot:12403833-Alexandrium_andersonii.AAC.1